MLRSRMSIRGRLDVVLRGPDGRVKEEFRRLINTVTALGDAHVADQMSDQGDTAMSHMAVGSGSPSATALGSEEARVGLTSTTQGAGANDNDIVYVGTFGAGVGTAALTEAGVFNATPAGTMFVSASFSVINKGAGDSLTVTWTVTFGS